MDMINAYRAYFLRHPPTHMIAAWAVGYKPPRNAGKNNPIPAFMQLPDKEE